MPDTTLSIRKKHVQEYWDQFPQGSKRITLGDYQDFFTSYEKHRYQVEPLIPRIAEFEKSRGKNVLEIGCGVGTDLRQFSRNGALVTGLDISTRSAKLAATSLRLYGLPGNIIVADAESLPFRNGVFDYVYSYGVLHHTPNTYDAIQELHRVLKHQGNATVMLYHKYSFPYFWILLRYGLLQLEALKKDESQLISDHTEDAGWSPLTKFYTRSQALLMFEEFSKISVEIAHIPRLSGVILRMVSIFQHFLGFYMIIRASK